MGREKEITVKTRERATCRELFQCMSDPQTTWQFVILPDDGPRTYITAL